MPGTAPGARAGIASGQRPAGPPARRRPAAAARRGSPARPPPGPCPAGDRRRCRGRQRRHLRGGLRREPGGELIAEPSFCPSGSGAGAPGSLNAGRASQIASFTCLNLPGQRPEPLPLRSLPLSFLQFRARPQMHRDRLAALPPGQVVLRPVAPVARLRAPAVRLAALAEHRVERAPAEVTNLRSGRHTTGPARPPAPARSGSSGTGTSSE